MQAGLNRIVSLLTSIAGCALALSESHAAELFFADGFETGTISLSRWNPQVYDPVGGATLVTAAAGGPVRSGDYALRIKLAIDDPLDPGGKHRSELRPRTKPGELAYRAPYGIAHVYSVSIFLPTGWQPNGPEIVAQWHAQVDRDAEGNLLEPRRAPPLALRMTYLETSPGSGSYLPAWDIVAHWDETPITPPDESTVTKVQLLEPLDATADLDSWVDWRFEVTWDWNPLGEGRVRVLKGGVEVASYDGPNAYNDEEGVNSKIGSYKWNWLEPVVERVVYYDDVRITREVVSLPALRATGLGLLWACLAIAGGWLSRRAGRVGSD